MTRRGAAHRGGLIAVLALCVLMAAGCGDAWCQGPGLHSHHGHSFSGTSHDRNDRHFRSTRDHTRHLLEHVKDSISHQPGHRQQRPRFSFGLNHTTGSVPVHFHRSTSTSALQGAAPVRPAVLRHHHAHSSRAVSPLRHSNDDPQPALRHYSISSANPGDPTGRWPWEWGPETVGGGDPFNDYLRSIVGNNLVVRLPWNTDAFWDPQHHWSPIDHGSKWITPWGVVTVQHLAWPDLAALYGFLGVPTDEWGHAPARIGVLCPPSAPFGPGPNPGVAGPVVTFVNASGKRRDHHHGNLEPTKDPAKHALHHDGQESSDPLQHVRHKHQHGSDLGNHGRSAAMQDSSAKSSTAMKPAAQAAMAVQSAVLLSSPTGPGTCLDADGNYIGWTYTASGSDAIGQYLQSLFGQATFVAIGYDSDVQRNWSEWYFMDDGRYMTPYGPTIRVSFAWPDRSIDFGFGYTIYPMFLQRGGGQPLYYYEGWMVDKSTPNPTPTVPGGGVPFMNRLVVSSSGGASTSVGSGSLVLPNVGQWASPVASGQQASVSVNNAYSVALAQNAWGLQSFTSQRTGAAQFPPMLSAASGSGGTVSSGALPQYFPLTLLAAQGVDPQAAALAASLSGQGGSLGSVAQPPAQSGQAAPTGTAVVQGTGILGPGQAVPGTPDASNSGLLALLAALGLGIVGLGAAARAYVQSRQQADAVAEYQAFLTTHDIQRMVETPAGPPLLISGAMNARMQELNYPDAGLLNMLRCENPQPTTDPRTGEPATRYSTPDGKCMVVTESGEVIELEDPEREFWAWWSHYTPPPVQPASFHPILITAVIPSSPPPAPPVTSHPGPPTGSGSSQGPPLLYAPDGTVLGYAPVAGSTTAGGTPQNPINCTYTGIVTSVNAPFYTINCSSTGITSSWNAPQNPFPCASTGMTTSMNAPPDPIICYTYGIVTGGSGSAADPGDSSDPSSGITWGTGTSTAPTPSYSTGLTTNPWAFAAEALFGSSATFTAALNSALAMVVSPGFDLTGAANTAGAPITYSTTGSGSGSGSDASGWPSPSSDPLAFLRDLQSSDPFSVASGGSPWDPTGGGSPWETPWPSTLACLGPDDLPPGSVDVSPTEPDESGADPFPVFPDPGQETPGWELGSDPDAEPSPSTPPEPPEPEPDWSDADPFSFGPDPGQEASNSQPTSGPEPEPSPAASQADPDWSGVDPFARGADPGQETPAGEPPSGQAPSLAPTPAPAGSLPSAEPGAAPGIPGLRVLGTNAGGGTEVTADTQKALQDAGAKFIRWDNQQGKWVGVVPPPGWDFSNPLNDKETFVKWMMLAGHPEALAIQSWNKTQEAKAMADAGASAMAIASLFGIPATAAAAYSAARSAMAIAQAAGDSRLVALWRSVVNALKGGGAAVEGATTSSSGAAPLQSAGPGGTGVWDLANFPRGGAIEDVLGRNLPRTFPVIDKFANGIATSIKSMDLGSQTYSNPGAIARVGQGYIDKVAGFQGARSGGVTIESQNIAGRAMDMAVPPGATAEQQSALQGLVEYGVKNGVKVRIITVP